MSTTDPRHYDVIISPVITEKATLGSEHNQVMFKVAKHATKPQIKEAVEKLFDVKVKSVNTHVRKGKVKAFKGTVGEQSEVKRAIVTLEEGHRIDVTTGSVTERRHGTQILQPRHAEPAPARSGRSFRPVPRRAGQEA